MTIIRPESQNYYGKHVKKCNCMKFQNSTCLIILTQFKMVKHYCDEIKGSFLCNIISQFRTGLVNMFMEVVCLHYLVTNKTLHIALFFINITKRCPCVLQLSHHLEIKVMVVKAQLQITQMKFELLTLFCNYFLIRAYLFNFYERK